jgi:hypothetical protein
MLDYATPLTSVGAPATRLHVEIRDGNHIIRIAPLGFWRYHVRMPAPAWTLVAILVLPSLLPAATSRPGYPWYIVALLVIAALSLAHTLNRVWRPVYVGVSPATLLVSEPVLWGRRMRKWPRDSLLGLRTQRSGRRVPRIATLSIVTRRKIYKVRVLTGIDTADLEAICELVRRVMIFPRPSHDTT